MRLDSFTAFQPHTPGMQTQSPRSRGGHTHAWIQAKGGSLWWDIQDKWAHTPSLHIEQGRMCAQTQQPVWPPGTFHTLVYIQSTIRYVIKNYVL